MVNAGGEKMVAPRGGDAGSAGGIHDGTNSGAAADSEVRGVELDRLRSTAAGCWSGSERCRSGALVLGAGA